LRWCAWQEGGEWDVFVDGVIHVAKGSQRALAAGLGVWVMGWGERGRRFLEVAVGEGGTGEGFYREMLKKLQ